jgi:hypothetical protein
MKKVILACSALGLILLGYMATSKADNGEPKGLCIVHYQGTRIVLGPHKYRCEGQSGDCYCITSGNTANVDFNAFPGGGRVEYDQGSQHIVDSIFVY